MRQEEIQQLLERYMDGETTNQEEQALRQYFATAQALPQEWRVYRALFGYIGSQQGAAAAEPVAQHSDVKEQGKSRLIKLWAYAATAAACAALALTLALAWPRDDQRNYAVIDGRTVTSSAVIAQEAELALQMVSDDDEALDALDLMN